jgi:hypothetical protein
MAGHGTADLDSGGAFFGVTRRFRGTTMQKVTGRRARHRLVVFALCTLAGLITVLSVWYLEKLVPLLL